MLAFVQAGVRQDVRLQADPSPLCLLILYVISSRSVPSTRYFPPALSLHCLTCWSSFSLLFPLSRAAVVAAVFFFGTPAWLRIYPAPYLFLPPDPPPQLPSSLRLLHPPAPPLAPPPPAPAAYIARKDIYMLAIVQAGVRHDVRLQADGNGARIGRNWRGSSNRGSSG